MLTFVFDFWDDVDLWAGGDVRTQDLRAGGHLGRQLFRPGYLPLDYFLTGLSPKLIIRERELFIDN